MLFNKNNYRKAGEKKVLHKVGKEWKVVSVALLMAIAGGAAATHANANADANTDNADVDATVAQLNTSATANPPHNAAKFSANSSVASSASVSGGPYYYSQANNGFSGYNGSAASYFDDVSNENTIVNNNYSLVNNYVQSLNAEYNPQMHSFAVKSASDKNAASNDSKLAKSYDVTARNTNTFNTIQSLAAKNNMNANDYVGMVKNTEQNYSAAVSNASDDVTAANDVNSLVNKLETTNLSQASLQASVSSTVASSNLNGAIAASNSVDAKYHNVNTADNSYIDTVDKLDADASGFSAAGNVLGNDTAYSNLLGSYNDNNLLQNSVANAVQTAVSAEFSNASSEFYASSKANTLSNFADTANTPNSFVSSSDTILKSVAGTVADANLLDNGYKENNFTTAVSAANNYSMANFLYSAANSLLGSGNSEYANARAYADAATKSEASASAKVRAATYASEYTEANSHIISFVDNDVNNVYGGDKSAAASAYLAAGVNGFASSANILTSQDAYNSYVTAFNGGGLGYSGKPNTFASALASDVDHTNTSDSNVVNAVLADAIDTNVIPATSQNDKNSVVAALNSDVAVLNSVASNASTVMKNNAGTGSVLVSSEAANGSVYYELNNGSTVSDLAGLLANSGHGAANATSASNLMSDAKLSFNAASMSAAGAENTWSNNAKSATAAQVQGQIYSEANVLASMANVAAGINDGLKTSMVQTLQPNAEYKAGNISNSTSTDTYGKADIAALLSDGIDFNTLSSESGAIANIANTVKSANVSNTNSDVKFNDALSIASSSANSVKASAETASAGYSSANDESVTLSTYFASSYATEADNNSEASVKQNNSFGSYLQSMADDDNFNKADQAYVAAQNAASVDYKLGVGYAQAIYNNHAHFLDVLKNAKLHSTPNFNTKSMGDKVVGSVNKGDRLTVLGVNVSRNNNWRGVVRYFVKDNTNGAKGFITGQGAYTKAAYYPSIASTSNVEIKTLKPVNVYDQENGGKVVAKLPAGKVLENADVVYDSAEEDAYGFTKVETASDDYLTANTDYVEIVNPSAPTPTNNVPSEFNFNLGAGQNMAPYYNNLSQN